VGLSVAGAGGDESVDPRPVDSFDAFVAANGPELRRALVARFGLEVGVDVTADALAYAWEHWSDVSTMAKPIGYLFRVGQSAARRYRKTAPAMPPAAVVAGPEHDPRLARALERLSARQRSAVVLVCVYDWTYPAAAEVLGIGESSLRNHVRRGLAALRRELGDDE
jgi:DNA-directed RNA polymerase specialized sigma24 family protein